MSKFAPAGIKSQNGASFAMGMSMKKKKSKAQISIVESENVRNMKNQQKHIHQNQSKISKDSASESYHDNGSEDLEAELEKLQQMDQRKMGKAPSPQNFGPRTLLNIDEIGPDFIDDSPNNSLNGKTLGVNAGPSPNAKTMIKKRSSTSIIPDANALQQSQNGGVRNSHIIKGNTKEKFEHHHAMQHGNYEKIVNSKKRISLEERMAPTSPQFKQQEPMGRSFKDPEDQELRASRIKSSAWSNRDKELYGEQASTKHGGQDSSRSKREFYLNFEQMADYHRNNEEEQYLTTEVRVTNEYYNRIIVVEYISVFFSTFGVAISMVLNELKLNKMLDETQENYLLSYIMFSTVALVITLYFRYQLYLKWYMYRGLLTEFDNLVSTNWWQEMIIEQILVIFSPYPYLQTVKYTEHNKNWDTSYSYDINQIMMCLSFTRIYIHLRYALIVSKFMNPRSKRICTMNGCEAEHMFAIKAIMKEMPYTFISFTLTITIFLFGYQLKVFEGPLSEVSGQNFNLMSNSMWNVIITLTTTGYGDIYPKTNLGRFVGLIVCFWGTFVVSFFVVTVNNMLSFTASEDKSYTLLQRLHFKEELKRYAVNVLSSAYKHRNARMKEKDDETRTLGALRKFRGNMLSFQQAVMRVRNFYEGDTETDILMRLVDNLREDVDLVKKEQEFVNDNLAKVVSFIEKLDAKTNAAADISKSNTGVKSTKQSRNSKKSGRSNNNNSVKHPYHGNNSIQEEEDEEDDS